MPHQNDLPLTTPEVPSPASIWLQQLDLSEDDTLEVLQHQPNYQIMTRVAFELALEERFPALPRPIEVSQICVRYVEYSADGDRVVLQTLSELLDAYLATGMTPNFDEGAIGFYPSQSAMADSDKILGITGPGLESIVREVGRNSVANFLQALDRFWQRPHDDLGLSQTPQTWLAITLGAQRRTEGELRAHDGTFTADGKILLDRLLATDLLATDQQPDGDDKPGKFSLSLQGIPLSAVVVLTRSPSESPDNTSGPVLLLIPGQGLLEFGSGIDYQAALRHMLEDEAQRSVLLGHDLERSTGALSFQHDALAQPAFAYSVQSLLTQQKKGVDQAADLQTTLGLGGILASREQHLLAKATADFLQPASPEDRQRWVSALKDYQAAWQRIEQANLPPIQPYLSQALYEQHIKPYASAQTRHRIKADLGIDLDPDQVLVWTTQDLLRNTPYSKEQIGTVEVAQTLTDLMLRRAPRIRNILSNVPVERSELRMNNDQLADANDQQVEFSTLDREPLSIALSHAYLTALVRELDIGQRYDELLRNELLDGPRALRREPLYAAFLGKKMHFDALEARIAKHLRTDRALQWVQAVLNEAQQPNPSAHVEGHRIQVQQLQINGNTLRGIQVIAPATRSAVASLVLHTPEAPDSKHFREYADSAELKQEFINHPDMRRYILEHITQDNQGEVNRLLERGVRGSEMLTVGIDGNFLQHSYRAAARHIIANANAATTSNSEADNSARYKAFNQGLDMAGILLPTEVMVPLSLARFFAALFNAHEAWRRGEPEAAREILNGIRYLGDSIGLGKNQQIQVRPRLQPAQTVTSKFYQPYSVPVSTLAGLSPNGKGIYRDANGHYYIRLDDGMVFPIHADFKVSENRVQITRLRSGIATGIFLFRDAQGIWSRTELPGGGGKKRKWSEAQTEEHARMQAKNKAQSQETPEQTAKRMGFTSQDGSGNITAYNKHVRAQAAKKAGFGRADGSVDLTSYNKHIKGQVARNKGFVNADGTPDLKAYNKHIKEQTAKTAGFVNEDGSANAAAYNRYFKEQKARKAGFTNEDGSGNAAAYYNHLRKQKKARTVIDRSMATAYTKRIHEQTARKKGFVNADGSPNVAAYHRNNVEQAAKKAGFVNDDGSANLTAYKRHNEMQAARDAGFVNEDDSVNLTAYRQHVEIQAAKEAGFVHENGSANIAAYKRHIREQTARNQGFVNDDGSANVAAYDKYRNEQSAKKSGFVNEDGSADLTAYYRHQKAQTARNQGFVNEDGSPNLKAYTRHIREQAAKRAGFTRQDGSGDITAYNKHIKERADQKKAEAKAGPSHASMPPAVPPPPPDLVTIKREPGEPVLRHQIDNTLPILQDPANPLRSLLLEIEGPIEQIKIARYLELNDIIDSLPRDRQQVVKQQMQADVQQWLRTEGAHAMRFNESMEVIYPLDDGGPLRGTSVYAKRDIAQFEVVGPYAGKLYATQESLSRDLRKTGQEHLLTYLWETRSKYRNIGAFGTGNTLSLINTSQIPGQPAWKSNNLTPIYVGKNLIFYVALTPIKQGEELLVNYGDTYNPRQGAVSPKQEPQEVE